MAGVMESLNAMKTPEEVTLEGKNLLEDEIILTAIRESCGSDEEFAQLMNDAAVEMALYNVISDADIATEATKKIIVTDWKAANFNRIQKRTAIRLAMINNDALYAKYRKYRDLFLQAREGIYKKYGAKAKQETKKILMNARRKSANMPSPSGKSIVDKIDKQIDKATGDKD